MSFEGALRNSARGSHSPNKQYISTMSKQSIASHQALVISAMEDLFSNLQNMRDLPIAAQLGGVSVGVHRDKEGRAHAHASMSIRMQVTGVSQPVPPAPED